MPTYPFSLPAGVNLVPASSGSQAFGSAQFPWNLIVSTGLTSVQSVKMWCVWDQSSAAPVLSGSFNVASLTDGGAGLTTIVFANAIGNTNYTINANCSANATVCPNPMLLMSTGVKLSIVNAANTGQDLKNNSAVVFAN